MSEPYIFENLCNTSVIKLVRKCGTSYNAHVTKLRTYDSILSTYACTFRGNEANRVPVNLRRCSDSLNFFLT